MDKIKKVPVKSFLKKLSSSIGNFFRLFFLKLSVETCNFIDFISTAIKFYTNISFMKIDLSLLLSYLFKSPYRISKEFLTARHESDVYAYGETPLTTMQLIAKQANINKNDVVVELGCGRGRTSFWLNQFCGSEVIGVDYVPTFIEKAKKIAQKYKLNRVHFRNEDMLETDLNQATVIYLYGTCLSDEDIKKLTKKFSKLASGTKIITVSYSLSDYSEKPFLEVMKVFEGKFAWGSTEIYIHHIK